MYDATLLAILASTSLTTGLYFLKRQADRHPSLAGGWRLSAWWALIRDPVWLFGLVLQIGGFALYLIALRGAPLSVVHTALNGGVACFVLLAVVGLGERPRPLEWLGVSAVSAGLVALGLSSSNDGAGNSVAHGTLPFSLVLVGLAWLALLLDPTRRRAIGLSVASGLTLGLGSVYAKELANADSVAAALGSVDLLVTFAANLIGFAVMQAALQAGRGVVVVPIFSTLSNLVPIIGGIVVYGEWLPQHGPAAILRPLAFVLALGGAALLAGAGGSATSTLVEHGAQVEQASSR
jgi:multidrug transporter EmrE-like cation transporter